MMKRFFAMMLALMMLAAMLPVGAIATEVTEETRALRGPGQCGDDLTWSYDGGTLTISGTGEMDDYTDTDAPWLSYKDSIEKLVFTGGVTSVGECAFKDYDRLKDIEFGTAMHTIGYRAFYDCDGLTTFTLPATFRRFGEECFMSCDWLREIRCLGGMPSFKASCLWDCPVSVFYPTTNPWPAEYVTPLYQSYQGKIQIFMGDGIEEAGVEVTEATQPQPAETEATVPETTAPETEPATEPTETATEAAATEAAEAETQPQMTEPEWLRETEPEPVEEKKAGIGGNGLWFGLFLITGTLSLVLIGALIFRRRSY